MQSAALQLRCRL